MKPGNQTTATQGGVAAMIATTLWSISIFYLGLEQPPAELIAGSVGAFTALWQFVTK